MRPSRSHSRGRRAQQKNLRPSQNLLRRVNRHRNRPKNRSHQARPRKERKRKKSKRCKRRRILSNSPKKRYISRECQMKQMSICFFWVTNKKSNVWRKQRERDLGDTGYGKAISTKRTRRNGSKQWRRWSMSMIKFLRISRTISFSRPSSLWKKVRSKRSSMTTKPKELLMRRNWGRRVRKSTSNRPPKTRRSWSSWIRWDHQRCGTSSRMPRKTRFHTSCELRLVRKRATRTAELKKFKNHSIWLATTF